MKHNRIAMMAFILIQLFAGASQLKAQFRIVDEQDGKPVSGAYVFSSKGTLLCISDADGNVKLQEGMVTISNLAYEPLIQPTVQSAVEREDATVRLDVLKSQALVEFSALLPTRVQLRLPPTTNKGAHCYGGNQRLRDNRRKDHDQGGGEGGDEGPQRNRPVRPTRLSAGYTIRRGCGDKRPAKEKFLGDVDVKYNYK